MKKGMIVAVALMLILAAACTPDENTPIGGKGGTAILKITPQHHGVDSNLVDMMVYIKYNTKDAPTGFYDDSAACIRGADKIPVATLAGLKKGAYYLYASGLDTGVHEDVHGGIPYTIYDENTQTVHVPVSEH